MTTPDPALVAAAAEAAVRYLQEQAGLGRLAPAVYIAPVRDAWVCARCGAELPDTPAGQPYPWPTYCEHLAANHHSLLLHIAGQVDTDDAEFTDAHSVASDPHHPDHAGDVHTAAVATLAEHLAGMGWPAHPDTFVQRRQVLA